MRSSWFTVHVSYEKKERKKYNNFSARSDNGSMSDIGYGKIYAYASYNDFGKMYVPVNPSNVVYAQFDNISGVAARNGERSLPINMLRVLNSLIEHAKTMHLTPDPANELSSKTISSEEAAFLIDTYQSQIRAIAKNPTFQLASIKMQPSELLSIEV